MKYLKIILFLAVLTLSIFLRFYNLDKVPPGLNADETSLGYDAYSILLTGKDQYGKTFPIFLRSFGAYQSPLYAYLTIIPISIFGLSIFSVRFLSALVGVMTVIVSFIIAYKYTQIKAIKFWQALIISFVLSLLPWSIFFSRTAVEANLGLFLVVLSTYFLLSSLQKPSFFVIASILLGISTYAYQSQRLGSILFLLGFILIFLKKFRSKEKIILIGLSTFFIIQIPQLLLINTQAGMRRLNQVNYFSQDYFVQNAVDLKSIPYGVDLKSIPLGHGIYILNEFSSRYIAYFSPKNLFSDPDPQQIRSIPDLSVFYGWMFIPFLFGLTVCWERRKEPLFKMMFLIMVTSAVPAALTREPFYTLRVLPLLWILSIMISLGGYKILQKLRFNFLRIFLLLIVLILSISSLITSYFILLKYERGSEYGFPYIELSKKTQEFSSKKFIVDLARRDQSYIWFAFFNKYDPHKLQEQGKTVLTDYYNSSDFTGNRIIDNVELTTNIWEPEQDPCMSNIIVGDFLSVSEADIKNHGLSLEFSIPDLTGKAKLKAYSFKPQQKCY